MGNQNGWKQQMWPKLQKVEQGQNESTQGLRPKNAEIGKHGTESNKSDQIPKLIDGGQI